MDPRKINNGSLAALLAVVLMLSVATSMYPQVTGATLSGTITDPSGSVIPGAQISVTNTATGINQEFQADSAGYYTAPNLAPGTYEVKVTAQGFNTTIVGAQQQLHIAMKVGEASQTVQVTGAAQQGDLASSTLTAQVESQTILELPLNGRDWTSLATLNPGVNLIETQVDYVDAIQEFSVLTGGFSAEYGKATGGVVNAITKSGTNSIHGDA